MTEEAVAATPEPEEKRGFTLPSAYTILFVLIVVAALATWVIPAGTYELNERGRAEARDLPRGDGEALEDCRGLADRADQRPVRDRELEGEHQLLQHGDALRRDRHRAVHSRDRRIPRRDDEVRGDPGRDRQPGRADEGQGAVDDPGADVRVRAGRHHVRDGRGEPGVLCARDPRDDRRRLRRAHRRGGRSARLRDRGARLDGQPVRDGDRVRDRRRFAQRRSARAAGGPARWAGDRHLLRAALRRPGQAGSVEVGRLSHEGRQRGSLPR